VAVGLGAGEMVGVGETVDGGVGDGAGVVTGVGVGDATGLADGDGDGVVIGVEVGDATGLADGDGFGVGEGFAAIIIPGNPKERQATKPSNMGAIWGLFFGEIFTVI